MKEKTLYYMVRSQEVLELIRDAARAKGLKVYDSWRASEYPLVSVKVSESGRVLHFNGHITGAYKPNANFDEIMDAIAAHSEPNPVELRLNSEYSVKYVPGEKTFTVGCQKFPVSVIDDLVYFFNKHK